MTFDPTKPVQTRDGRPARIIATGLLQTQPILAVITYTAGERSEVFNKDGSYLFVSDNCNGMDLINIPRKVYVNVWEEQGLVYSSYRPFGNSKAAEDSATGIEHCETARTHVKYLKIAQEIKL